MPLPTFDSVVRRVLAHCPLAPPLLAASWVQDAYQEIGDRRPWSHLRTQGTLQVAAARTGTCTVTSGSLSVVGSGLVFIATDVGRQFRLTGPPYTIVAVDTTGTTTATLDRPFGTATQAGATGEVLDALVTLPEDFGRFISVVDPVNSWRLHLWITEIELNDWDPSRESSGDPGAVVASSLSPVNQNVRFELWPYRLSAAHFPYWGVRRPEKLQDDSTFSGPLRHRDDLLLIGALHYCALWPGLENRKNPYASLDRAAALKKELDEKVTVIESRDEEIYLTWIEYQSFASLPHHPLDAKWQQSHEVSLWQ